MSRSVLLAVVAVAVAAALAFVLGGSSLESTGVDPSQGAEYVDDVGAIDVDALVEDDTTAQEEFNMSPYR